MLNGAPGAPADRQAGDGFTSIERWPAPFAPPAHQVGT
jgi:hypothetical protein